MQTEVFVGIGSAESGCGGIGCADRLRWGQRVCRQRSVGPSGVETEVCGGIVCADRGLWRHRVCRQSSVVASGL